MSASVQDRSQQAQSSSATDSQHPTTIAGNTTCLHTSESFNDFLYWREPVATLDIGEDSTATSNPQEVAGNAKVVDQLEEMEDEEAMDSSSYPEERSSIKMEEFDADDRSYATSSSVLPSKLCLYLMPFIAHLCFKIYFDTG